MYEKCFSLASTRIVSLLAHWVPLETFTALTQVHSTTIRFIVTDVAGAQILAGSTAAVMTLTPGSLSLSKMATRYAGNPATTAISREKPKRMQAEISFSQECFDEIGEMFARDLKPPARGAASRQDKLSPLKEMGPEQLQSYTSEQLGTVLKQHEIAVDTALSHRYGPFISSAGERPYIVGQAEECKATLCPRCGRAGMGEDLSWLSIDGVLKGDIPASAAVGYGFRALGGRPVADANIVKNLGRRDPETGQLPEKTLKGKDECLIAESPDIKASTEEEEALGSPMADENNKPLQDTEGRNLLAMGDWEISPEMERLDSASIMADKGSEDNEDLIDFYVNSEEGRSSGSRIPIATETKPKEKREG